MAADPFAILRMRDGLTAANTIKGYRHDWKIFAAWCSLAHRNSFPATAETLCFFVERELTRGRKISTTVRRVTSVKYVHRAAGFESPAGAGVQELLVRAQRLTGEQPRQMEPLSLAQIRTMSEQLRALNIERAFRDRAILVIGFASALRRASLADLLLSDVQVRSEGLVLHIRREKQDQEGRGRNIGLPIGKHEDTSPASCYADWLRARGSAEGPLFFAFDRWDRMERRAMTPASVGKVVKRAVRGIGLDPARYSGHSLRSGFITEAAEAGAGELLIASQTGHRSMEILRRYFRRRDLFKANACFAIGL